jgi:hypothetical protein
VHTTFSKRVVVADPFPFRVGLVRLAYPGWLNGEHTTHDPRAEFAVAVWEEEA